MELRVVLGGGAQVGSRCLCRILNILMAEKCPGGSVFIWWLVDSFARSNYAL